MIAFSGFLKECEEDSEINLTHFICFSSGSILAEYIRPPYKKDGYKLLFSMTKSLTSLAVGIARDKGLLKLEDFVVTYFKDELPQKPHENLSKIKIRHLLTMTSGIHDNTYTMLVTQDNWVRAFLAQDFPHEPGTFYRYSTHGSHMLSAIIQKVSGLTLEDFLNKFLFFPMAIYEAKWESSPEGITAGGMGLSLYPQSLVKIAQLLLNGGIYNNEALLSEEYIAMATTCQAIKQDDFQDNKNTFCGFEYGFQFHICKEGYYRADGAFGQLCLLCPEKRYGFLAFSQKTKMEKLLSLIYKYFIEAKEALVIDNSDHQAAIGEMPEPGLLIPEARYKMEYNPLGIDYLEFGTDPLNQYMKMVLPQREDILYFNLSYLTEGKMHFIKDLKEHYQAYVCRAKGAEKQVLELTAYFIETPYVVKYRIAFERGLIKLDFSINVSFTLKNFCVTGVVWDTVLNA